MPDHPPARDSLPPDDVQGALDPAARQPDIAAARLPDGPPSAIPDSPRPYAGDLPLLPPASTEQDAAVCSSLLQRLRDEFDANHGEASRSVQAYLDFLIKLDLDTGTAARVECLLAMAQHYYLAAKPAAALPAADRAVAQTRVLSDLPLLRKALTFLGAMYMETGNLPEATACFSEALAIAQQVGDSGAEAPVWNNLGLALQNAAQYADAIQCFERAAALADMSAPFSAVRSKALSNIASCALHLQDVRTGIKAVRKAIELNPDPQTATDCLSRVISESNYARLLLEVGETGHASEHGEKARIYAAKVPTARAEFVASLTSGLIDVHSGRMDVGLTRLKRTLEQARLNVRSEVRDALSACVTAYEVAGQPDVALVYLHELLALNKEAKQAQVLMHHREHLARLAASRPSVPDIDGVLRQQHTHLWLAAGAVSTDTARAAHLEHQAVAAELTEDPTGRHAYRVGKLCALLGEECGMGPRVCQQLELAGRLHDIGKLMIPDAILRKAAPLSASETQIVQQRASWGAELLAETGMPEVQIAQDVARHAHERWDGAGYPAGLAGAAIPIYARIAALAEAFDVMTHDRPYRRACSPEEALAEIELQRGMQFDPSLADIFVSMVRRLLRTHPNLSEYLAQSAEASAFLRARDRIRLALSRPEPRGRADTDDDAQPATGRAVAAPPAPTAEPPPVEKRGGVDDTASDDLQELRRLRGLVEEIGRTGRPPDDSDVDDILSRAQALAEATEYPESVECLLTISVIRRTGVQRGRALACASAATAKARRLGEPALLRKALTFLGPMQSDLLLLADALSSYEEALALAQRLNDPQVEAAVWGNMSVAFLAAGSWRDAELCAERAIELSEPFPDYVAKISGQINLALVYERTGRIGPGIALCREALARLRPSPRTSMDAINRAIAESCHVRLLIAVGDFALARRRLALLRRLLVHPAAVIRYEVDVASALLALSTPGDNITEALATLERVVALARKEFPGEVVNTLLLAVHGYRLAGQHEVAEALLAEAAEIQRSLRTKLVLDFHRATGARPDNHAAVDRPAEDAAAATSPIAGDATAELQAAFTGLEHHAVVAELAEDPSGEHPYRVGKLARLLAEAKALRPPLPALIEIAGRLHNIGRLLLPEPLLRAQRRLTPDERKLLESEPSLGADLIAQANIAGSRAVEEAVRHRAERWDGSGYPLGLASHAIPVASRCVAIADVFDLLVHGRPYKPAWPIDDALREIERCAGTQFDPDLVPVFVSLVRTLQREHRDLGRFLAADALQGPYARWHARLFGRPRAQWREASDAARDPARRGAGHDLGADAVDVTAEGPVCACSTPDDVERFAGRALTAISRQLEHPDTDSGRIVNTYIDALLQYPEDMCGTTWVESMLAAMRHAYLQADLTRVLPITDRTLRTARRAQSLPLLRKALTFAGAVYSETSHLPQALQCFVESISVARTMGDRAAEAPNWNNAGFVFFALGAYADARRCHERAVHLSERSSEFRRAHIDALVNIAACANRMRAFADAMRAAKRGLALLAGGTAESDQADRALLHGCMVHALLAAGHIADAEEHAREAVRAAAGHAHPRSMLLARLAAAQVTLHRGRQEEALREIRAVIDAVRHGAPNELLSALEGGVALLDATGHVAAANIFLTEAAALRDPGRLAQAIALCLPRHGTEGPPLSPADSTAAFARWLPLVEDYAIAAELAEDSTGMHPYRVGSLARMLAEELGLDSDVCAAIELAARLHDIGKLAVPPGLLALCGRLAPARRLIVERHADDGAALLMSTLPPPAALFQEVARHTHERWDGTGYPSSLRGEGIPISARIVAVAETFDVLTHRRPYKRAWSINAALEEIERGAGSQFDPSIANAFVAMVRRVSAASHDFESTLTSAAEGSAFLQARRMLMGGLGDGGAPPAPASAAHELERAGHRDLSFVETPRNDRLLILSQIAHDMKHPAFVHSAALIEVRDAVAEALEQINRVTHTVSPASAPGAQTEAGQPLALLHAVAALLQRIPEQINAAEFSHREMRTAMEDIVDALRFDAGGLQPRVSRFALNDLFAELGLQHASWAAALGVDFRFRPAHLVLLTDRRQLQRLLSNLIINAIGHSGGTLVTVEAELLESGVRLRVSDNGRGIDPSLLPYLFSLNKTGRRSHDNTSLDSRASGIGLYLARLFAQRLEGELSASSEPGKGTTFTLTLGCFAEAQDPVSVSPAAALPINLDGMVVAVLDDHKLALKAMTTSLQALGATVIAASDPLEYVTSVSELPRNPDLMIVDFFVGTRTACAMTGWLESLHSDGVPVAVVTARPDSDQLACLPPWIRVFEKDSSGSADIHSLIRDLLPNGFADSPQAALGAHP